MNAKMPELKAAFEKAGFTEVKTVISSGNVVFNARSKADLERKAEAAMEQHLGRTFYTIVRPVAELTALLEADPFSKFRLSAEAKRIVTFLRKPYTEKLTLPIEFDNARILEVVGSEVFCAYLPSPRGPAFMTLLEKTFGKNITTRTWDTVKKCAKA